MWSAAAGPKGARQSPASDVNAQRDGGTLAPLRLGLFLDFYTIIHRQGYFLSNFQAGAFEIFDLF